MKTLKGPAIFLAQFAGDAAPFDTLPAIARWAHDCGFEGVQIPSWDARLFDLRRAAESDTYCDEVRGTLAEAGVALTELSTHLQGQLVAVHPAYDVAVDGFADPAVRGNPAARQAWAVEQLLLAARASRRLGLTAHATFSGALAWPFLYPFPQRPPGLVETAFDELAARWRPILDAFDAAGCDVCYELHPSEDLHDGLTFEMLLERVGQPPTLQHPLRPQPHGPAGHGLRRLHRRVPPSHPRLSRQGRRIHAERASRRLWRLPALAQAPRPLPLARRRPDRFFATVFSKLAEYDFDGWAVLEWECCLKDAQVGAREGAAFIRDHIIPVTARSFDDFAAGGTDMVANRRMLGL